MTTSNIKDIIDSDVQKVWETVLDVKNYDKWRSDISKTEIINKKKFIEYTDKQVYQEVKNINAYLLNASEILMERASESLCGQAKIAYGSICNGTF